MPERDDETGRFEASVEADTILEDVFETPEPRSTREVADLLGLSRSRTYELLSDLEAEGQLSKKKFDELGGIVWFREHTLPNI